jgi:hypothetical protein
MIKSAFDREQLKVLADILENIGNISLASVVLPYVIPHVQRSEVMTIIGGLVVACLFWTLSVLLVKNNYSI